MSAITKKIILVLSLLVIAAALLATNAYLKNRRTAITGKEISIAENTEKYKIGLIRADSVFSAVLRDFSVPDTTIKKKGLSKKVVRVQKIEYHINLPGDLPFAVLLQGIGQSFSRFDVRLSAVEKSSNETYQLDIFTRDSARISASFTINHKSIRQKGSIAFILDKADVLDSANRRNLFISIDSVAFLINPSKANSEFAKKCTENRKEYIVLISGKTEDLTFKLGENFSKKRLVAVVKSYFEAFPTSPVFLADDKSPLYSSVAFPFIRDEFIQKKKEVIPLSKLKVIDSPTDEECSAKVDEIIKNLKPNQTEIVIIPAQFYLKITEKLDRLRKKGVRIAPPSRLLQKMSQFDVNQNLDPNMKMQDN